MSPYNTNRDIQKIHNFSIILPLAISVILSTTSTAQIIDRYAKEFHVRPEIPIAIALAESGLDPTAKNQESTASGIFEFTRATFQHFCIDEYGITPNFDYKDYPAVQAKCAVEMIANGYISRWDASKPIWSKLIGNT